MSLKTKSSGYEVHTEKRHWKLWLVMIGLILPATVLAGYTWITLHYTYSSGERSGYVQKISNKGWICKTWEGELAVTTVPGTAPQIFQFTVRDDATAHRIDQLAGQRVALAYQQHKGEIMFDLDQAVKERHSTRMFLPQPVPRGLVDEALARAVRDERCV